MFSMVNRKNEPIGATVKSLTSIVKVVNNIRASTPRSLKSITRFGFRDELCINVIGIVLYFKLLNEQLKKWMPHR